MLSDRLARRPRAARMFLLACLGAFLAGATLAACGNTGPGDPPQARESCGQVEQLGPNVHDPQAAETCFWQHYVNCQAAELDYTMSGVDSGTTHTLVEWPANNGCAVVDIAQNYVIPTQRSSKKTYVCASLKQKDGGLLVAGCGSEGDIFVPPANQS
jgi:predicted small lipoprotein YifL